MPMNKKEYLERLNSELKGFSPQEKAVFIEEIGAHIEEGQADNQLGDDGQARNQKLMDEMGSPNEMGHRLKEVHRPNRWIDFLLVFIPSEIIMALILIVSSILLSNLAPIISSYASQPYWMATIRISFILTILMAIIARQRRSVSLLLYWLPQAVITTFSLLFRKKRWELQSPFNNSLIGIIESLFWVIILVILFSWLVYTLSTNRNNPLLIVLAIIPFLIMFGNMSRNSYISIASFPNGYVLPNLNVTHVLGFPIGLYQISEFIWPLLFYVFSNKQVRWIGLFFYAVPISMMNLVASISYPRLIVIWMVPSLIVIVGWFVDRLRSTHQPKVVTW
jgi:hypothetical protein